jgi:hypothetical protein
MAGELDIALKNLLAAELPDLFGGTTPKISLSVVNDVFALDPSTAEAAASAPRPDDQLDSLAFDPAHPEGPYQLTKSPYPGPRRIRLRGGAGELLTLEPREVVWDEADPRTFTLALHAGRDVSGITNVEALYGVTAVFAAMKGTRTLGVALAAAQAGGASLREAEALAVSVIALNRERLAEDATTHYQGGDYSARAWVDRLRLVDAIGPTATSSARILTFEAQLGLRVDRALREDEGAPIERIRTPGRPLDPNRRVDVAIEVDA